MSASTRGYLLRDATLDMVGRLAQSEREFAWARTPAEWDRAHRACRRRFKAVMRLTAALRDEGAR